VKQFSPSADRNKDHILACLREELAEAKTVLEIGSGTGQHEAKLNNVLIPIELDVNQTPWPIQHADVCYTCNTFHIMSLDSIKAFFRGCQQVLGSSGKICVYGPFFVAGMHTAESNVRFDQMLRHSDPLSGVRNLDVLNAMAAEHHFTDARCVDMPANNLLLIWEAVIA